MAIKAKSTARLRLPITSPARVRRTRAPRALKCRLREIVWAGGWVAEAAGVEGWFWIVDGCKRPEAAVRRVEKWARAGGFAIAWQSRSALASLGCAPSGAHPSAAGRARGLRCRITRWGGGWVAEGAGPGPEKWLCIADGRKRPETTRHRVEEWARANGIAIAWDGNVNSDRGGPRVVTAGRARCRSRPTSPNSCVRNAAAGRSSG